MDFVKLRSFLVKRAETERLLIGGLKKDLKRDNVTGDLREYYSQLLDQYTLSLAEIEDFIQQIDNVKDCENDGNTYIF